MASPLALLVVKIFAVKIAGTACPADEAGVPVTLAPDKAELRIEAPAFEAKAGKGFKPLSRLNCSVALTVGAEPGWQFTPTDMNLALSGDLAAGAEADVTTKFYYSGQAETAEARKDFGKSTPLGAGSASLKLRQTWSPCGKDTALVAAVAVKVKGAQGQSKLAVGSPWRLALAWRECK